VGSEQSESVDWKTRRGSQELQTGSRGSFLCLLGS
jgi:hypothetical protein